MASQLVENLRRDDWDKAMLTLLVERPELQGQELLAAVISEANDALARLKERGMFEDAADGMEL